MMDNVEEQSPRDRMRVADTDREQVAGRLQSAHAEGRLDLAEYDERVRQAWAARTYGELDRLTADLPRGGPQSATVAPRTVPVDERSRGSRRAMVAGWLSVSLINLVIWATVCLSRMDWVYPWWIWVVGPLGAVLLAGWITERSGGARRQR
jgi:hypothetical protein